MTGRYRLHYAPDNASLIVRLVLEELGQPYQTVLVDRRARAQRSPEYLALNPAGLIPVLETPDGPMFETGAIALWLADRHGGLIPPPGDPARAAALKWLFFLSNTLHPALRMIFYPDQYSGDYPRMQAALRGHMQGEVVRHLDVLDHAAGEHPALFSGTAPGVIGLYLGPALRWAALYPVGQTGWFDLSRWPHLHAMARDLEARASTLAAIAAEGLGSHPFTAPCLPDPPEGAAL
ncbi:MAG: glutathione S-transferase family protein [Roseovarius sp.]|nr:glutathione S-transferase family protein [Roseovarius sp.]